MARALVHHPAVLFLDEPTAGLDPQSRLALWDIPGKLRTEGQTILLTTRYMEEADSVCDRLAIMDHGRLLAMGTPKALKESVGADTTHWAQLLMLIPLTSVMTSSPGLVPGTRISPRISG